MSRSLFSSHSSVAYQQYAEELASAITSRDWVYDPSYALGSDREIYSKIMRDPVAAHAIRFRKHLVAGVEWQINPASDTPADKAAASIVKEILERLQGFTDARIRLASSIFRGSSYAFIEGKRQFLSIGGGVQQAWWTPTRLIDVDRRRFRLVRDFDRQRLLWQLWSPLRHRWEVLEHPEWFVRSVFDDTEDSLGYGRGLLDTLYYYQASKARVLQDALAASERFGQGFLIAKIKGVRGDNMKPRRAKGGNNQTVADAWAVQLKKHRARNIMVMDAEDELELLTGFDQGWKLLANLLSYTDIAQVTAVLGSSLSTMQSMNEVGSNAKAKTHEDSTETLVQADRLRMGNDLSMGLVGAIWRYNRFAIAAQVGTMANMPHLTITQQKREDPTEAATVISTLLTSGVPLKKDEVYGKTGFTVPQDGDEVIEPTAAAPQMGGGLFLPPGFSQRRPDAGVLSDADQRELERVVAHASNGDPVVDLTNTLLQAA